MEHLSTFQLTRDPFANEPQLSYYYESPVHQSAERRLERAMLQSKGLCLVTGAGGVGKTMLVRHFLENLPEEAFEACMLVPIPGISDSSWVLDRFARQLGVEEPAEDDQGLIGQIYEQLAIVREDGRHTVLIFDEAQVLADQDLLGNLRGLLNLEYEDRRMVSVILVGLPGLDHAIQREASLANRVDLRVELSPLDPTYATQYVSHRILAAQGNPAIFEAAAVEALVKWSRGVPRHLNSLADNALFEAHLAGRVSASATDVEVAAGELKLFAGEPSDDDEIDQAQPPQREADSVAAQAPPVDARAVDEEEALELEEVVATDTNPLAGGTDLDLDGPGFGSMEFGPGVPKGQDTLSTDPDGHAEGEIENLFADLVDA